MTLTVSVIMAMRDAAATIREAVQSIAMQSYSPEEFIIVDDGSSDDSTAVAQAAMVEFGIAGRIINSIEPAGAGAARNRAAASSKGDVLAILDGDDCWTADHLAHAIQSFDNPDLMAYCARVEVTGQNRTYTSIWKGGYKPRTTTHTAGYYLD
jgi:glycosyltransferase involved in cell wall biosynthesis